MKTFSSVSTLILLAAALTGCGGSNAGNASRSGRAHASLRVIWPKRKSDSRLIPLAANSLVVTLSKDGQTIQTKTIARPTGESTQTDTLFDGLDAAAYQIVVRAFPTEDGAGIAQATGTGILKAATDESGTVTVSLGSTVSTIEVATTDASVKVGGSTEATVSAKDADGNLVLLSAGGGHESVQWTVEDTAVATVVGAGPTATITGVAAGGVKISATMIVDDSGATKTGSANLSVAADATTAWEFSTGGGRILKDAISAPDGTVYFGSYGGSAKLYALNTDGTQKWAFAVTGGFDSSPARGADGTIYAGGTNGKLYAINPDGTQKWVLSLGGSAYSPSIGTDGTIYVGGDLKLCAIDPSGSLKWSYAAGGTVWAAPTIADDGTVYFGSTNGKFTALDANGHKKWDFSGSGSFVTGAAIGADGTVYVGSASGTLYALDAAGGKKWEVATGNAVATPAVATDGTIYAGSGSRKLYAFDATGNQMWSLSAGGRVAAPSIAPDGTVYVAASDGKLYSLRPDGTKIWEHAIGGSVSEQRPLVANGRVYIGTTNGTLYAYQ